jgi:transglutaminase-like putative cysteine protease
MNRTTFIKHAAAACSALGAAPRLGIAAIAENDFRPMPGRWRAFKVTTVVTLPNATAPVRAWIPVPVFEERSWMLPRATTWNGNASAAQIVRESPWNVGILYAQWLKPGRIASLRVISVVATRDRSVDLSRSEQTEPLSDAERKLYTSATRLMPTDGIVAQTAAKIVGSATDDAVKAKLIYDWVVVNAARNPKTRGCGLGDVSFMLETGDLSGKCADINGLFVALVRAAGIPARDLYGIRVAPSRYGYKSLGAGSAVITKAQHCRAEVYLSDFGWVPADPADVRKVMLEEPPGHLSLSDPKVADARKTLFGAWEGNYVAYNDGHDISLPDSRGPQIGFLMYPQAEVVGERRDSLAADDFIYAIYSEEIPT